MCSSLDIFLFSQYFRILFVGKGEEQALAAELLAVLAIQTGGSEEGDSMFSQFKQFLSTIILDQASAVVARSKVKLNVN